MVKKNLKQTKRKAPKRRASAPAAPAQFGAVSRINTAPVAIGNSLQGSKPAVLQSPDGVRVVGRDFAFATMATSASITNWEQSGGMPITPAVLCSSTLRNFAQIYNKFKFNKLIVHFITSSPTSQPGDIMVYYEKNRNDPMVDYSSNNFMNFVMSDARTVLGPQWTNHSANIHPVGGWKTTSFAITHDMTDDTQGSIYLFSKTASTNAPGYVLIDYDITFKELSLAPRAGQFPVIRGMHNPLNFGLTTTSIGTANPITFSLQGNIYDGSASAYPSGFKGGDVYKFVLSYAASIIINSAWTNATASTLIRTQDDIDQVITLDDGFTCYIKVYDAVVAGSVYTVRMFPTVESAVTNANAYHGAATATVTCNLLGMVTLVTSTSHSLTQSSY